MEFTEEPFIAANCPKWSGGKVRRQNPIGLDFTLLDFTAFQHSSNRWTVEAQNNRHVIQNLCFKQAQTKMCHSPKVDDKVNFFLLLENIFSNNFC